MTRHASGKAERLLVELEVSAGRQEEAMRDLEVRVRRVAHLERRARTERNVWRSAALLLGGVFSWLVSLAYGRASLTWPGGITRPPATACCGWGTGYA